MNVNANDSVDDIDIPDVPNCVIHHEHDSVDICSRCENPFCAKCLVIFEGADLCRTCLGARAQELETIRRQTFERLDEARTALAKAEAPGALSSIETLKALREKADFFQRKSETLYKLLGEVEALRKE